MYQPSGFMKAGAGVGPWSLGAYQPASLLHCSGCLFSHLHLTVLSMLYDCRG
jgi:hypothetical protein